MKSLSLKIAFLCLLICLFSQRASGSGFDSSVISAYSFSQGNAVVAHNDDASCIFFNPALMNKLGQSQIKIGTNVLFTVGEFRNNETGNKFELQDTTHFLPSLFATYKFNDNVTAGLGVFTNFGLSSTWPDDWEGRYLATKSKLTTFTINPSVSVRLCPNIYIGGGIDILTFDVELNKNLNLSSLGLPDIKQKMEGDDIGLGYNLGLLVDITEDISVGASYRSGIDIDIDGEVSHEIPNVISPTFASLFSTTSGSSSIELPPQAFVGIAYKGIDPFIFEVMWKWIGWSSYDELKIKLDNPIAWVSESVIPKNWKDTYYIHFGTQYKASDIVTLNAGYIYDKGAIPDETYEPAIPENDAHVFCLGSDINYKNLAVGVMYAFKKIEDREKNNSLDDNPNDGVIDPLTSANGKYKNSIHFITIDITYRF